MLPTTTITAQQCVGHTAPTLRVLVKKYTPCQGVVWSQYRSPGIFYVPLGLGVVLIGKVCFLLPAQFDHQSDHRDDIFKTCAIVQQIDTLSKRYCSFEKLYILHWLYCGSIGPYLYLMNYSSDFNIFCRFQLLAVCTTLL